MKIFVIIITLGSIHFSYALSGSNVCNLTEEVPEERTVITHEPYEVKTFTWCLKVTPRCPKKRIQYRLVPKKEVQMVTKTKEVCCKGFAETGGACIPLCSNACIHGVCIAPEKCECLPGFGGPTCNVSCPKGKWGLNCQEECQCSNDSLCDPTSGRCTCRPGWQGPQCDVPCSPGYFGVYCMQTCNCRHHSECNHITGLCHCIFGNETGCNDFAAENLELEQVRALDDVNGKSANWMFAFISIPLLVIVALCAFLILRYKNKLRKLKTELNYVSYSTNGGPGSDLGGSIDDRSNQDQFDNPVYAYTQSVKLPNNHQRSPKAMNDKLNGFDRNDFKFQEKQKVFEAEERARGCPPLGGGGGILSSSSSMVASGALAEKQALAANGDSRPSSGEYSELDDDANLDNGGKFKFAAYNPNIYHSIDDVKPFATNKEPFYEEVKKDNLNAGGTTSYKPNISQAPDGYDHPRLVNGQPQRERVISNDYQVPPSRSVIKTNLSSPSKSIGSNDENC